MAEILSKTFDTQHGAIFLSVKDAVLGNVSSHSVYLNEPGAVIDPNAAIASVLAEVDATAQTIHDKMVAAGWVRNGS